VNELVATLDDMRDKRDRLRGQIQEEEQMMASAERELQQMNMKLE
jgi:hypothetical protein